MALSAQLNDERPASDEALRSRVVGFIEARLSDRDLTPAKVAAAHHMSVRRLHKLFEDQPLTVAALIRRRRLEQCRAELAGTDRTVAAVAARWGFADPAHFSRLFKATYGYNAAALTSSNRARRFLPGPIRMVAEGIVRIDLMQQSVEAMSAIPARMIEGRNRGDAAAFLADFADDAELVDFEGTVHKGREQTIAAHQPIFDTVMKGSRLVQGEVLFVRIVGPGCGVVHHRMVMAMPGEQEPPESRRFLQLLVVVWQNDRWEVASMQNSRLISLETAMALQSLAPAE